MPKRSFKLTDDVYLSGRWELGHPLDQEGRKLDDPWKFRIGLRAHSDERIRIPIKRSGKPLDYSHAAFSIPAIHARVASLFTEVAPDTYRAAWRRTSRSLHFESTVKCNSRWCMASTRSGCGHARAAMGSTLLHSLSGVTLP